MYCNSFGCKISWYGPVSARRSTVTYQSVISVGSQNHEIILPRLIREIREIRENRERVSDQKSKRGLNNLIVNKRKH